MPAQTTPPQPTPYTRSPLLSTRRHMFTFALDSDLVELARDQARNNGMTLEVWVATYANEGIKLLLGC
jgi:hypothetical protein